MNSTFISFGELLLRMTTVGHQRFEQASSYESFFGGAEANVAASLSLWGLGTQFITTLPTNPIGESALSHLKKWGIGTAYVDRAPHRMGLYFLEQGNAIRSSQILYDRSHSAFASHQQLIDWKSVFKNANWFHTSGITPALSSYLADQVVQAFAEARKAGVTTSFDLNYRSQLWTREEAKTIFNKILPNVDIFIGMDADMESLLGISYSGSPENAPAYYMQQIQQTYGCKLAVTTLRKAIGPNQIEWSAIAFDGNTIHRSTLYEITQIDRIGTGDAFTAGLIYAYQNNKSVKDSLEFGAVAGAWKHSVTGDFNLVTINEIESVLQGDRGNQIRR